MDSPLIGILLALLGVLQQTFGFVLNPTPLAAEQLPEGVLQNVNLQHLSSAYLNRSFSDPISLTISSSKIEKIDKHAFDHLVHLNFLEISDSQISTPIDPQTFSRLPGLEILILRNIRLRHVNLDLMHVQDLILSHNEIETLEGETLVGKDVSYLDVSDNHLRTLKGSFANMSKLTTINISKNKISEIGQVFAENVNLLRILASENRLASTEGFRLPWLKTLDLFSNNIAVLDSNSFAKMKALENLVLAFNDIKKIEDNAFDDLLELKYLDLAWNHIEELKPELLLNNPYLTKLSLQGNKIKFLKKFRGDHHLLNHLDLSHNQLNAVEDDFFESIPNLQVLDLGFNRMKVLGDALAPLTELKTLNLEFNLITMNGNELSKNEKLTYVNLSSNILQEGIIHFKSNLLLKELDVSDNNISDFCHGDIFLEDLMIANLRGNKIRNLLCLGNFTSLCGLDLRNNPLECGEELDDLMLKLTDRKGSPRLQPGSRGNLCGKLSSKQSLDEWSSVKRELCPSSLALKPNVEEGAQEWETSNPEQNDEAEEKNIKNKLFLKAPIRWFGSDEMNKPNSMDRPQSERTSWENIEKNEEFLPEFEEEDIRTVSRFSWQTTIVIFIVLFLILTVVNLVVAFYIRFKICRKLIKGSPQKYTILHNEIISVLPVFSKSARSSTEVNRTLIKH